MNFLWNTNPVAPDLSSGREDELPKDMKPMEKPATTLEGLIAADPYPNSSTSADGNKDGDGVGDISGIAVGSSSMNYVPTGDHSDVSDNEGWVTIPYKELSDGWSEADDILQLRSLDRSFVFPGEQLHILVCLKASKQETEVMTPFKVAAVISKNISSQNVKKVENSKKSSTFTSDQGDVNYAHEGAANQSLVENGGTALTAEETSRGQDISATESILRMEEHKQITETLLERFKNSNFFARIAQSNELLWSKRTAPEPSSMDSVMAGGKFHSNDDGSSKNTSASAVIIDRGSFDGNTSGGVARNTARCFSLCNGDIVVLLQVNVAKSNIKDPVLEVLQFEKYTARTSASENLDGVLDDPCHELLSWLLPLDRSLPPSRPLSPPLNSPSVLASASHRSTSSSSSGSQIFGHFRSYSMPTLPPVTGPSSVSPSNSRPAFDLEDFDRFLSEKLTKGQDVGNGLLSFRGVPLEPERFSVHCGLEGIFLPGRRWRRKLEIVQPIKIHSFAFGYATEDLLCVQIKNVCPAHLPDIIIFLDAISIVFEEASKVGPPISLPIACIETGNSHSLPNLALRRGDEHSFIMKPASTICANHKDFKKTNSLLPNPKTGVSAPNMRILSRGNEGRKVSPTSDQYAVLVSCRSNYSESKLFFKQPTSWRPQGARDLVVSVESETSKQAVRLNGEAPRLPVQVLTLQASNLTSEDLTLTVVAPISSNSSPSVVSLNSGPTTPMSPFAVFPEFMGRVGLEKQKEGDASEKKANSLGMCTGTTSDVISSRDLGCTHLWLQSTVPLGCVPAHSSATVKLELLPLTDGIITLDTLQIAVKEKGEMYAPEQPLKIYVTSSISTGTL